MASRINAYPPARSSGRAIGRSTFCVCIARSVTKAQCWLFVLRSFRPSSMVEGFVLPLDQLDSPARNRPKVIRPAHEVSRSDGSSRSVAHGQLRTARLHNIAISLIEGFEGYGLITTPITSKASIICPDRFLFIKEAKTPRKRNPKQGREHQT
jgi:hypothetical protein